jgi:hypothetical protein
MANSLTTVYQVNGSKYFTAKIDLIGDGSGEVAAATIIDPADLTGKPSDFKVRAIQWGLDGNFVCQLLWDASTDLHAFEISLPAGGIRFADTGAHLVNNSSTGKNGKLLLTTTGLTSGGKATLIIEGQHS